MADNIGTAYVQIEPSFEGVTPKIENHFSGEGQKAGSSFGSAFGSVAGTVGKAMAGAAAAGAVAVGDLVKNAVSAYSEFEQLEGGAKLLFGDAFSTVMANADSAFARVQMSANDYLTQANGYATGLKEALGGDSQAAAELADRIMVAQADVVAATGTSAESVQNAFAGIMKSNFTMLDNLQLGIKPTKEGMQEVIDKMNEWNAEQGKATNYQMGNLADMQSAIVDYVEYVGMAGYAHNEASETIQGSLASMKAAWENTLTAIAQGDGWDIGVYVDNLMETVRAFGENIMPIIEQALKGVSTLIQTLGPEIASALPQLISEVLPGLLDAGVDIIKALGEGLIQAIPDLMPAVTDVILELCNMLVEMAPDLIKVGLEVIVQLAMGIAQALPQLMPTIVETILTIVEYLIDNVDMLVDAAIAIILALADGLIDALPKLIEKAPEIIMKLVEALIRNAPKLIEAGISLIFKLIEGIFKMVGELIKTGIKIVEGIKDGFSQKVEDAKNWGKDLINNFINGLKEKWEHLKQTVSNIADSIASYLGFSEPEEGPLSNFHTYAPDMMNLYAKGIRENAGTVEDALNDVTAGMMSTKLDVETARNVQMSVNPYTSASTDSNTRIEALLHEIINKMQIPIVMDTGALVGATAGAYNVALGQIAIRGGRR